MKVEFDEIKDLPPRIWTESRVQMWMAKVWEILEKKGRTVYETRTEQLQIYMLAVSASAIYLDYNHIVFDEVEYYESLYENLDALMSENEIFFLYGRIQTDDPPESARDALSVLERDSRANLMEILRQEMSTADIAVGLYYTVCTPYFCLPRDESPYIYVYAGEDEDDEDDEEDKEAEMRRRQLDTYDGYWKMIREKQKDLIEDADFCNLMAGHDWLNENAYPIESF